jgi:hypothetical protein
MTFIRIGAPLAACLALFCAAPVQAQQARLIALSQACLDVVSFLD